MLGKGLDVIGLRIAVQTRCFAQPFRKALHTAARLGCEGVQFDARGELRPAELSETGLRQLRKMLDDLNLRVGSVAFPTRRGYANPQDLEARLEATRSAMQLASQLNARVLICNLGNLPADDDTAGRSTLVEALANLSAHGNRLGVKLTAQAASSPADKLVEFIDSLPEGTLSVDLHPGQLIAQGESPTEYLEAVGPHVAHVHAVDGYRDLAGGRGMEVELGRGSVDFPELFGLLEEFEYRDWITLERTNSQQTMLDIENGVRFLRSL
jgi:sugar phosphate isomerase/epimerase